MNDGVFLPRWPVKGGETIKPCNSGDHYRKQDFAFQGRRNCSWHMAPMQLPSWLRLITSVTFLTSFPYGMLIFSGYFVFVFPTPQCPVKHTRGGGGGVKQPREREKYHLICRKCHVYLPLVTFLWKDATACHRAVPPRCLCGPCYFSKPLLKCGGELQEMWHAPQHIISESFGGMNSSYNTDTNTHNWLPHVTTRTRWTDRRGLGQIHEL